VKCKRIVDFYHKPFNNVEATVSIEEKFMFLRKTIHLEGICEVCEKNRQIKGALFAGVVTVY
jgi:Fe2+ or Zn2+ uptake regulation protein